MGGQVDAVSLSTETEGPGPVAGESDFIVAIGRIDRHQIVDASGAAIGDAQGIDGFSTDSDGMSKVIVTPLELGRRWVGEVQKSTDDIVLGRGFSDRV